MKVANFIEIDAKIISCITSVKKEAYICWEKQEKILWADVIIAIFMPFSNPLQFDLIINGNVAISASCGYYCSHYQSVSQSVDIRAVSLGCLERRRTRLSGDHNSLKFIIRPLGISGGFCFSRIAGKAMSSRRLVIVVHSVPQIVSSLELWRAQEKTCCALRKWTWKCHYEAHGATLTWKCFHSLQTVTFSTSSVSVTLIFLL